MSIPTRAVKALITNEVGEILLLQRNPQTRGIDNWDLAGGLVEDGEDEVAALIREVQEELQVTIAVIAAAGNWKFFRSKDNNWVQVQNYLCKITAGEIVLSDEHIAYRWVKKQDIKKYPVKDESFYQFMKNIEADKTGI